MLGFLIGHVSVGQSRVPCFLLSFVLSVFPLSFFFCSFFSVHFLILFFFSLMLPLVAVAVAVLPTLHSRAKVQVKTSVLR